MAKVGKPDEAYAGRRLDIRVLNISLDEEAANILHTFAPPGQKTTGRFISRLLFEHAARVSERQRLTRVLQEDVAVS